MESRRARGGVRVASGGYFVSRYQSGESTYMEETKQAAALRIQGLKERRVSLIGDPDGQRNVFGLCSSLLQ